MLKDIETRSARETLPGLQIPPLGHEEGYQMGLAELKAFLALAESLDEADWSKPTACTLWDVRQIVAHLAGAAECFTSFKNFRRQVASKELKPYKARGLKSIHATNQLQVDDRAGHTPDRIIAELAALEPLALHNRYNLPGWLRATPVPIPLLGVVRVGYLTNLIYTRDMWMHRLDICRATGREMALTPAHDGRIVALVVRDFALLKGRKLAGESILLNLTGPAGGQWRIGQSAVPAATLEMDALDFTLKAAERLTATDLTTQNLVTVSGNAEVARLALENMVVPF